ncbi:unnamed protein product, partial [Polarella glacialis]
MVRLEVQTVLGPHWQRGIRRLGPEGLVRAGLLLARADRPPETSDCDASVWPEARRQRSEAVLRQLLVAEQGGPDLSTRDWAGALWAAARCRATVPVPLLEAASAAVEVKASLVPGFGAERSAKGGSVVEDFSSSDIARCFWAAATLRWDSQRFLQGVCDIGSPLLRQCSSQDLSNIAWASATLRFDPKGSWLDAIAMSFAEGSGPCAPQAVANVLWSIAKAHEAAGKPQQETDCPPGYQVNREEAEQDVSSEVLSGAPSGLRLGPAVVACLPAANAQNVANMFWAFAKLRAPLDVDGEIMMQASRRMAELLPE